MPTARVPSLCPVVNPGSCAADIGRFLDMHVHSSHLGKRVDLPTRNASCAHTSPLGAIVLLRAVRIGLPSAMLLRFGTAGPRSRGKGVLSGESNWLLDSRAAAVCRITATQGSFDICRLRICSRGVVHEYGTLALTMWQQSDLAASSASSSKKQEMRERTMCVALRFTPASSTPSACLQEDRAGHSMYKRLSW